MSLVLPLSRGSVDPMVAMREGFDARRAIAEGASVFAATGAGSVLAGGEGTDAAPLRLARLEPGPALGLIDEGAGAYLLGRSASGELGVGLGLALEPAEERALTPAGGANPPRWIHLRRSGHLLSGDDPAFAMPLVALAAWHASARFCARCGAPVRSILGGWVSECTGCHHLEYPRQDPAIIVRIEDGSGRVLLARNAAWPGVMHSLIAGFVEGGESPEHAVVREVEEEVGLKVSSLEYRATQPWPFPRSQMMGYVARLSAQGPGEPEVDGVEIDRARFYSREEFTAAIASGEITAPGAASIAHALLVEWYGAPLPVPPEDAGPLRRP